MVKKLLSCINTINWTLIKQEKTANILDLRGAYWGGNMWLCAYSVWSTNSRKELQIFQLIASSQTRDSQSGQVKRYDESFQAWEEEPLGTDSHRTISKRSRECWFLIGHKKYFVLMCPIGGQLLLSSFRGFVHDGYYLATVVQFVHQAFLTGNEGTTDKSKNVSDGISRSNSICTEKILFLRDHNRAIYTSKNKTRLK